MGTLLAWLGEAGTARKTRFNMVYFLVPPWYRGAPTGTRYIREKTVAAWKNAWV